MAAHHTVTRGSVGGRELGRSNENISVFQHLVAVSNTRMELYWSFEIGRQRITEHIMTYRQSTIGRTLRRPELHASAGHGCGCASTLFIGGLRSALRAFARGVAAAMLYPPRTAPYLRSASGRRDSGHPCNTADLRGVPTVGLPGLECWSDRPGPMNTPCRSRGET
jgi:hypothetical protein